MPMKTSTRVPQGKLSWLVVVFSLFCLFLPLQAGAGFATTPVNVPDDLSSLHLDKDLWILEDPTGRADFEGVLSGAAGEFLPLGGKRTNHGYNNAVFWVRVTLHNSQAEPRELFLELGYPLLDKISFFAPTPEGRYRQVLTGDSLPFSEREIAYHNPIFRLVLPGQVDQTFYFRLQTSGRLDFPLTLHTLADLSRTMVTTQATQGLFYGVMLAMVAYNLFLFFSIRKRSYLYYVTFILSYLLVQATLNGLAFQYLWPTSNWWNNQGIPVLCAIMIVGAIFFTRDFLGEVPIAKKLDRFLLSLVPLSIVSAVVGVFVNYAVGCQAVVIIFLLMAGLMYVVSIIGSIQGDRAARYYLLAWSVMLFGVTVYGLMFLGLMQETPFTAWSVQIGSALLVIQLSLGLVDHINVLRRKNEAYASDLERTNTILGRFNEELESRVEERTRELQEANEKLKELDQLKTDFLSTVSHELRTPLTSVLGFAKIIQERFAKVIVPNLSMTTPKVEKTSHQISKNLEIIVSEGERLTSLINDVLDLAKMEDGRATWDVQPLSIPELLSRAAAATGSLFAASKLRFIQKLEADLPMVCGNYDRLLQVLINLISNAVKFTPAGEVTCRASRQGDEVLIQVEDTGVGISEKEQLRLFEKFIQAGDTLTNKPSGTGLGLAICKEIVERHGGRIWVESQPGQGSTFFVSLPLAAADTSRLPQIDLQRLLRQLQAPVQAVEAVDGLEREILVVDDDVAIRSLLRQELEAGGFRVSEAADGLEGVARAKELQPDLVLLDVMMPKLDGFDAAAILKNDPQTSKIPIIMLTIIEDAERGYRLGVDRYLRKPVDIGRLLEEIGSLLSQGCSQKKVMIVDRNQATLATLSDALVAQGFQVVALTSEEECLRRAMVEMPDIIIVDRKLSDQHSLIKTLQFEKELENILFFISDPDEAAFLSPMAPG